MERLVGTAVLEEAFRLVGTSAVVVALALVLFDLDSVALSSSGLSNCPTPEQLNHRAMSVS